MSVIFKAPYLGTKNFFWCPDAIVIDYWTRRQVQTLSLNLWPMTFLSKVSTVYHAKQTNKQKNVCM